MPSSPLVFAASSMVGALAAFAAFAQTTAHPQADAGLQPAGKPTGCIVQSQITNTRVLDDGTIDFQLTGRRVYRNRLPEPCPELGHERAFSHATPTDTYCSGDLITVFRHDSPGLPGATCALGDFQPMAKAPAGS